MACTPAQEKLIDHLQTLGATIPCDHRDNPDFSYLDSVPQADAYIKQWKHLTQASCSSICTPDMLGVLNA